MSNPPNQTDSLRQILPVSYEKEPLKTIFTNRRDSLIYKKAPKIESCKSLASDEDTLPKKDFQDGGRWDRDVIDNNRAIVGSDVDLRFEKPRKNFLTEKLTKKKKYFFGGEDSCLSCAAQN